MDTLKIKFPMDEEHELEQGKPIVILGANGSGKTRLGVKIEALNDPSFLSESYKSESFLVQRISAQKSLSISRAIVIRGEEVAERIAFTGHESGVIKNAYRYHDKPVTGLLDDFDDALSYLYAKNNKMLEDHNKQDLLSEKNGTLRPPALKTLVGRVESIWNALLPGRQIDLSGNEVHVSIDDGSARYHGMDMSDGERVILYMIIQAMIVKPASLLIIDEPELHIHKAIMNKLWDLLEQTRPDCVFMYITHDLDFAFSRNTDKILWVKSYSKTENPSTQTDLESWEYEFLPLEDYSSLPASLLFEMIGTKQRIVFVEGTKDSLDFLLYSEVYRESGFHVIPCGGCREVINAVKAKKQYAKLKGIEVYGVIDRDFRVQYEIDSLATDGIFCLKVAEVENLFVVPALLKIMQEQLGCDESDLAKAEEFIKELFVAQKPAQIREAIKKELEHQLDCLIFDKQSTTTDDFTREINSNILDKINEIIAEKTAIFDGADSLDEILKVLNFKRLSTIIGDQYKLKVGEYPRRVINLLKNNPNDIKGRIIEAVKPYLPVLPDAEDIEAENNNEQECEVVEN